MRIWYDYQIFANQRYGGISRYFVELAARIQRYPETKAKIVAPLYVNKFLAEQSKTLSVLGLPFTHDIKGATGISRRVDSSIVRFLAKIRKPDIVHETYYSRDSTSNASIKTVITVYDTIEMLFPEMFPNDGRKKEIDKRKAAFSRADHLICISESTRADLLKFYGVNSEKVSVIHLASSLTAPAAPAGYAGEPYLLYVGSRGIYKNFTRLLEAFANSRLYTTHKLVCFGGIALTEIERETMSQLHIPDDSIQVVFGDDVKLSEYYASADAMVYPSLYEGFGIPLLEAMGCGCPVICSNTSSLPEVAGDAAMYFDPEDVQDIAKAMLRVVQLSDDRPKMIARGKLRAQQFSWDVCAQQTFAVYERLLARQ